LLPIQEDHAASLALFVISSAICLGVIQPYARAAARER
jgi:hypothetical protein